VTDRLKRLRAALEEERLGGLIVASAVDDVFGQFSANRRYVSGFSGSTGYALVTATEAVFAADFRYTVQAERECAPLGFRVFRTEGRLKDWWPHLCDETAMAGKRLGVSRADFSLGGYLALLDATREMPLAGAPKLVWAPPIVERLRRHKGPGERRTIEAAVAAADGAFERVEDSILATQTETEVAAAVESAVRACGGDGISFATIVASGPQAALPHAQPTSACLGEGRPITIDMGARVDGYCSDLTRTFTIGAWDARFAEIYAIVEEAQQHAIENVEAGMTGVAAHELAAGIIERHGYGERFGHGLGHGVGLEVHEAPYLGKTSDDTLEEGMIFTIEPGIYLPGWGGVRIEDIVVLEGGRARVLSKARKLHLAGVGH
jgi:Xaa-Pro aminopeptidase